jgi:hypothetical protein
MKVAKEEQVEFMILGYNASGCARRKWKLGIPVLIVKLEGAGLRRCKDYEAISAGVREFMQHRDE